jgi:DNA-binding SARP family transcriptional activator
LPELELRLLGPPSIQAGDVFVQVDTRKATALLVFLALEGGPQQRDGLAALFWPESDQKHARGALRRTLFALREAIGREWISADRETIHLNSSPPVWIDVVEFEQFLDEARGHSHSGAQLCPDCEALYRKAVELYRDDFMSGFSLRDSPGFDNWQFYHAQALRRRFGEALRALVEAGSSSGDYARSIEYARRWLAADPLNENAHRALMRLYAWSGQRSAAVRQYRECVRVLREELGVAPLKETTELDERIRAGELPERPAEVDALRTHEPGLGHEARAEQGGAKGQRELPFVGRSEEVAFLKEIYQSLSGTGVFVAVEGEAGVGKSRLAVEFGRYARDLGAQVIQVQAFQGESDLAFAPVAEALRQVTQGLVGEDSLGGLPKEWLSELSRLLPGLYPAAMHIPEPPRLDTPGAQVRFYEAINQVILRASRPGFPGLFILDDMHWADDASLKWLISLIRRLKENALFILFLYRSGEARGKPAFRELVGEAQRQSLLKRIPLDRLQADEVTELLSLTTGHHRAETAERGERLYHETEGLPLFIREYLSALERGDLAWDTPDWTLPGGVQDLLRARVVSLGELASQLLTSAAIIGRPFEYETLLQASGRGGEEAVRGLEELSDLGFLNHLPGDSDETVYDFSHAKIRELLQADTSPPRKRLLHKRIADAMAHGSARRKKGSRAALIAHHYQAAGEERLAAEYYLRAGDSAAALFANEEALGHYQRAFALGHPERGDLHIRIGDLYQLMGEYSAALEAYGSAAAYSTGEELAAAEQKLGGIYHLLGEGKIADGHYQTAETLIEDGNLSERAKLYADWSLTRLQVGDEQGSLDRAKAADELAERAGDAEASAMCRSLLGLLERGAGNLDAARSLLQESAAISASLEDPGPRIAALNNLALVLQDEGDLAGAIGLLEEALTGAVAMGDRHHEAALRGNLADALHEAGREEESMSQLKLAAVIFADIGGEMGDREPEIWKLTQW